MPEPDSVPNEYLDAEFAIEGLANPTAAQKVMAALATLEGIQKVHPAGDRLFVKYEPVLLSKKKIERAITEAGFQIQEIASSSDSPLLDALADD